MYILGTSQYLLNLILYFTYYLHLESPYPLIYTRYISMCWAHPQTKWRHNITQHFLATIFVPQNFSTRSFTNYQQL